MRDDSHNYNRRKISLLTKREVMVQAKREAKEHKRRQRALAVVPTEWCRQEEIFEWLRSLDYHYLIMLFRHHKVRTLQTHIIR